MFTAGILTQGIGPGGGRGGCVVGGGARVVVVVEGGGGAGVTEEAEVVGVERGFTVVGVVVVVENAGELNLNPRNSSNNACFSSAF